MRRSATDHATTDPRAETIPDAVLTGLLTGGVYALMAAGFTLIHGVLGLLNLLHGSLLVLAMVVAWCLAAAFEIDPYASLPLLTLLMFAAGWGGFRWCIGPAWRTGGTIGGTLATLVSAFLLDAGTHLVLSGPPLGIDMSYALTLVPLGSLLLSLPKVVGFAASIGLGLMLWLFMTQTDTGRSLQAVAQDLEGARLVGIRPERLQALAYGIGTACLGAAACLLLPGMAVDATDAPVFLLVSVAGAVLGGLGSLPGAVAGGLAVGVVQAVVAALMGELQGTLAVALVLAVAMVTRTTMGGRGLRA